MPRRRARASRFGSALYHASFSLFVLLLAALLVGSAWGLGEQAWRTDHQRRWNMFALIAAYLAVGAISIVIIWSRLVSVKRILRTMPKPYMPNKRVDVPKKVANHIQTEYSRTAVIAHISQATSGKHEGWGRPGTKWEGVHFRTFILGTVDEMRRILLPHGSAAPPHALVPLIQAAETWNGKADPTKPDPLRVFVASYASIVDRARYARAEPSESDAAAVEKVLEFVRSLVEVRRKRKDAEKGESGRGGGEEKGASIGMGRVLTY